MTKGTTGTTRCVYYTQFVFVVYSCAFIGKDSFLYDVRERESLYFGQRKSGKSFSLSKCSHDADTDTDYDTQILQLLLL